MQLDGLDEKASEASGQWLGVAPVVVDLIPGEVVRHVQLPNPPLRAAVDGAVGVDHRFTSAGSSVRAWKLGKVSENPKGPKYPNMSYTWFLY